MKHARPDYNRFQDPLTEEQGGIPKDEPVFLLRAKDICAPTVVMYWAAQARNSGADDNIVLAALDQALEMILWQEKHDCQIPDMP